MTRNDTIQMLTIIKSCYPYFYKDLSVKEANDMIDAWSTMFSDDNTQIVIEAVKALITTLKYPPTIADIKEKIRLITQPAQMSEIEAWNIVRKAISYYDAKEKFDALPEMLQKLVGSPSQLREWAQMDNTSITVVASNFMRSYKARAAHEHELAALPESTKLMIAGLSEKYKMIGG